VEESWRREPQDAGGRPLFLSGGKGGREGFGGAKEIEREQEKQKKKGRKL